MGEMGVLVVSASRYFWLGWLTRAFLWRVVQTWDCRLEPGVKAAFAKLWGTNKLVTSFDTVAIMMPFQPQMSAQDSSVGPPLPVAARRIPSRRATPC